MTKNKKSRLYKPGLAQRATSFYTQIGIGINVLAYDGDAVFVQ
jgi:hypothetical protein